MALCRCIPEHATPQAGRLALRARYFLASCFQGSPAATSRCRTQVLYDPEQELFCACFDVTLIYSDFDRPFALRVQRGADSLLRVRTERTTDLIPRLPFHFDKKDHLAARMEMMT